MEGIIIALIFLISTAWFLQAKKNYAAEKNTTRKTWIRTQYAEMTARGFIISNRVDDVFNRFSFAVDDLNARWVLLDATRQSRYSYSFSDLIRYELHQNTTTEIDNLNTAILGASAPRTVRHICRMMYLDLFVNDIRTPRRRITFLDSYTEAGSDKYLYAQDIAQNIIALLDYIDTNRIRAAQIDTSADTLGIASEKRDIIQNIIALLNYINANRNSSAEIGMLPDVSNIAAEQEEVQKSAKRHEPQQITLWDLASSSAQSKESNDIAESSVQTDGTRRQ